MESLKNRKAVLDQFAEIVANKVEEKRDYYPHSNDGDAFSHWALEMAVPELDSDAVYELLDIAGQGDQGLDASYRDEEDGVYYLFQSKFADRPRGSEGSRSFGTDTMRELFTAYRLLCNPPSAYTISDKFGRIADDLVDAMDKGYEVRFCYLLFGWFSSAAYQEMQPHLNISDYEKVSAKVYDLDELYRLYLQVEYPQEIAAPITVPYSTFCEHTGHGPRAIIANVDLTQFALKIAPYRPTVYSANVRNPLGYNRVNKGIRKTVSDPDDRAFFWHYNNGITLLCNDVSVDEAENTITVEDPTIINGCQTMETVVTNIEYLGDVDVPVLVRFIELPNHRDEASNVALKIARFTNSQTQVIAPDLRSTDEVQTQIQMLFEHLPQPWFYERKRGEWNFLRNKHDFDSNKYERVVRMPDIAQRWYAFEGCPAEAISNKAELFESDEIYYSIFTHDRTAREFGVPYLIYERLLNLFKQLLESERQKTDPNERLLRLTRATTLACTQMLALTRCIIDTKYGDFDDGVASSVMSLLQDANSDPIGKMFLVLRGCLLSKLRDDRDESVHAVLRNKETFKILKNEKLPDELSLAEDNYGISPLDAFS